MKYLTLKKNIHINSSEANYTYYKYISNNMHSIRAASQLRSEIL